MVTVGHDPQGLLLHEFEFINKLCIAPERLFRTVPLVGRHQILISTDSIFVLKVLYKWRSYCCINDTGPQASDALKCIFQKTLPQISKSREYTSFKKPAHTSMKSNLYNGVGRFLQGGQSEARLPVFKSPSKLGIHLATHCSKGLDAPHLVQLIGLKLLPIPAFEASV
ncbi:hypothetical protein TNCV_3548051 [Trichonephila clavipes]|nr:hypothetical protein TNCV_3548051 [Trichonephila clavipes]